MRRIVLTISYDGTSFFGYQVQNNLRTVQKVLEDALFTITGEKIKTIASGRTDSGVHAKGQVVHFDTNSRIPANKFYLALNGVLDKDVRVLSSKCVKDSFHARYSAKAKTYKYSLYTDEIENPLKDRYSTHYPFEINDDLVKKAIDIIVGTHDFKCFLSSGSSVKDTVRTIYKIDYSKKGKDIIFTVKGNGFLYNMVRILVGTILQISEGKISLENLKKALEVGDRKLVGKTLPANALCLYKVYY